MDAWQGIGTAGVAALVSVAVTLAIRFWESTKVSWLVTGEAHDEYEAGRATGRLRANIEFHNVGDGDAFGVITTRRNGDDFESFDMFERGKVPAGGSIKVVMQIDPERWQQAWVELHWASSPTGRSKPSREGPHRLHEVLWHVGGMPHQAHLEEQARMPRMRRKRR